MPKKVRIKIINCPSKDYWYFDKLGQTYDAIEDGESMFWVNNYKTLKNDSETGGVFKRDVEIIQ